MNEEELATLRLKMRAEVRQIALEGLTRWVRATPTGPQVLATWGSQLSEQAARVVLSDRSAVESDLLAAEMQEALREMLAGMGL